MEKQMFELKLLIFRRWIKNEIFPEAFTRHRARRELSSLSRFRREIINLILFIHVNIGWQLLRTLIVEGRIGPAGKAAKKAIFN